MGLGGTAKKLQRVADMAEDVYTRLNDVRTHLEALRDSVKSTDERVARLEHELAEQRALVQALAESQDIDVEATIADAHIEEAERAGESSDTHGGSGAEESSPTETTAVTDTSPDGS